MADDELVEEKTPLERLEERLTELEKLSCRKDTPAHWKCEELIRVVMATFAPPKLAVVMKALLTFPEKTQISTKQLSERMKLDKKQMREYLAALKSMGYVIETTGKTEWAQTKRGGRGGNNRNQGKAAMYHVDFWYFMMMTKFRLYQISKRLSVQQKKEDETGDGYVCNNEDCFCCYKIKKIMDLINEQAQRASNAISNESHFVCSECGQPLIDAEKYLNNSNRTLTKTKRFNLQTKSLRMLLTETLKEMKKERQMMQTEISKLEDAMDRIRNGSSHSAYKASTLSFDGSKSKSKNNGLTGLDHLDRIGKRQNFVCNHLDTTKEEKNGDGDDGQGKSDKEKEEDIVVDETEIKKMTELIKKGIKQREDENEQRANFDALYSAVTIRVNEQDITMSDLLNSGYLSRYEEQMSTDEWNIYQQTLDELGLLEIE